MEYLIPHHQRMLAGEITTEEYRLEYLEPTLASLDKPTDLRTYATD